jgi:glycosyltransferase involved in cell wall biosynthesis
MTSKTRLEVFFDMTRTVQSRGKMAGAVRVESEFAATLVRAHPKAFIPIAWSSSAGQFIEMDRDAAVAALSGQSLSAEPVGSSLETARPPDPGARRIVVVTGAGWLSNLTLLHGLIRLRRMLHAELQVVVHDLVHLRYPQWAPRDEALRASSAHEAMLSVSDRVLVYSDATARDIAAVADERRLTVNDIGRMALGTAFVSVESRPDGLEALKDRPFVLYVSSVAARKNHQFIAEVWSRLAGEMGRELPRLLFVGRAAADQKEALERLTRNPSLEDHLIHVSGASDEQLAWLYEHCLFTVFPSLYEGWGLPVAESLAFGRVCLASNAGSIPEAAGGVTPLLDPLDVTAWCDAVRTFIRDRGALAVAESSVRDGYRPITWEDASLRLWDAVVEPLTRAASPAALAIPQAPTDAATLVVTRQPWKPLRDRLGLVAAYRARRGLLLEEVPPNGLRVALALSNEGIDVVRTQIEINGFAADSCFVPAGKTMTREIELPRDVLLRRGLLDISTTCKTATPPSLVISTVAAAPLSSAEESAAMEARRDAWHLDDVLHFSVSSRHVALLKEGWDEPAGWGVWSVERRAEVRVRPAPAPLEPIELTAIVRGFVPPAQPRLDVEVHVGGHHVTTWSFVNPTDFSFVERRVTVPPDLLEDGWLRVTFVIPEARSPRELGMGQDERHLGIGLVRLHAGEPAGRA